MGRLEPEHSDGSEINIRHGDWYNEVAWHWHRRILGYDERNL
jgi:hypothetical protein